MKENDLKRWIEAYLDGADPESSNDLRQYAERSEDCTILYEDLCFIREEIKTQVDLPKGFREEMSKKLKESAWERAVHRSPASSRPRILWASIAAVLVLLMLIPSIRSLLTSRPEFNLSDQSAEIADNMGMAPAPRQSFESSPSVAPSERNSLGRAQSDDNVSADRKVIYTYRMEIEVVDLEAKRHLLERELAMAGGYLEESAVHPIQRREGTKDLFEASFVLRVPVAEAEHLLEILRGMGKVGHEYKGTSDVTLSYSDLEAQLRNLSAAEERYLALYAKAESIEDMLHIEAEITRLRGQIDQLLSRKKTLDHQIEMSTIHLYWREVLSHDIVISGKPDLWSKAWNGMLSTINAMIEWSQTALIWFVSILPVLVIGLVLFGIGLIIFRLKRKHNRKKGGQDESK